MILKFFHKLKRMWCFIYGHKFYNDYFYPDGGYERDISGITFETGQTVRVNTDYCTRCGELKDEFRS